MLKNIPALISPELLKVIAEMGHGDELVLADANFPGTSIGKRCIRCDGHGCAEVMGALLTLFPLDDFVKCPLAVMEVPDGMFEANTPPIWKAFREAADTDLPSAQFEKMEHDAFMDRARAAYAVVHVPHPSFGSGRTPEDDLLEFQPLGRKGIRIVELAERPQQRRLLFRE